GGNRKPPRDSRIARLSRLCYKIAIPESPKLETRTQGVHRSQIEGRPMFIRFLAPLVAIIFSVSTASAQIYQWSVSDGGNGHYFEFVQQQLTWSQANAAAQLRTFNGVNGHLATDTSA